MRMRVLIVDREPQACRRVARALEDEPGVEVLGQVGGAEEAVETIRALKPDLVILDVELPGLDGFGVLQRAADAHQPLIVFVTASDRHARRAFEVHAVDYVLKPFGPERIRAAVHRAIARRAREKGGTAQRVEALLEELAERQRALGSALAPRDEGLVQRLLVKVGERMVFVAADRVDWLEAEGNYVRLHVGKERYLVRATLAGLEKRLDPRRYLRIHRSTVVNLDRVREVRPWVAGDCIVVLHDGTELRMSRRYRDRLEAAVFEM